MSILGRKHRKDCWLVTEKMSVEPHLRIRLIGPSGINLKRIYFKTGTQITAEDETTFSLFPPSQEAMDEAKEMIGGFLTKERVPDLEFGGIFTATITELRDTGVMVTLCLYPSQLTTGPEKGRSTWDVQSKTFNIYKILVLGCPFIGFEPGSWTRDPSEVFQTRSCIRIYETVTEGPARTCDSYV